MDLVRDAYRVLQLDPAADDVVIHAAYRALARRFHPDGEAPNATRMAELNAAYAAVRTPEHRRAYDARRSVSHLEPVSMAKTPMRAAAGVSRQATTNRSVVLDFGRYAGWSIAELARHDPDYLRWLSRHSAGIRFRTAILQVLPAEPDLQRRANSVA